MRIGRSRKSAQARPAQGRTPGGPPVPPQQRKPEGPSNTAVRREIRRDKRRERQQARSVHYMERWFYLLLGTSLVCTWAYGNTGAFTQLKVSDMIRAAEYAGGGFLLAAVVTRTYVHHVHDAGHPKVVYRIGVGFAIVFVTSGLGLAGYTAWHGDREMRHATSLVVLLLTLVIWLRSHRSHSWMFLENHWEERKHARRVNRDVRSAQRKAEQLAKFQAGQARAAQALAAAKQRDQQREQAAQARKTAAEQLAELQGRGRKGKDADEEDELSAVPGNWQSE